MEIEGPVPVNHLGGLDLGGDTRPFPEQDLYGIKGWLEILSLLRLGSGRQGKEKRYGDEWFDIHCVIGSLHAS